MTQARNTNISLKPVMLRSAVVILLLIACYHGHAQVMEGLVLDQENSNAIPGVTIINKRSDIHPIYP